MQNNVDTHSLYDDSYRVIFPTTAFKNVLIATAITVVTFLLSGSLASHKPVNSSPTLSTSSQSDNPKAWLNLVQQQLQSTALEYPHGARRRGVEGVCTARFTVTESGRVTDAKVLKQCDHAMFEKPVLDALMRATFPPRYLNGKPTRVVGVTNRFEFSLDGSAL